MRAHLKKIFIIAAAVLLLVAWGTTAYAIDPPHTQPQVNCQSCHWSTSYSKPSGGNIDNTPMNMMCLDCHKDSPTITRAVTHSSNEIGGTGGYIWTYECRECHNPHSQEQVRLTANKKSYASGGAYLAQGTISTVTQKGGISNVINVAGTPWQDEQWAGYQLVANTTYNMMYRILNSSTSSLTVETTASGVHPYYVKTGSPYAIIYGSLIKTSLNTRKIIANSGADSIWDSGDEIRFGLNGQPGDADDNVTFRDVKLFNGTGPFSIAETTTEKTAICIVCHTRTKHMNIGYAANPNFDDFVADYSVDDHNANVSDAQQCWDNTNGCHVQHEEAFSGGAKCGECHGTILDGLDDQTLNFSPGFDLVKKFSDSNGNLYTITTGAVNEYAHPAHNAKGITACASCHTGGMNPPKGATGVGNSPAAIEIEFGFPQSLTGLPGAYSGRDGAGADQLQYNYVYNGTAVAGLAPTYIGDGTMTCDSVYCHSDGGDFGRFSFAYAQPTWNGGGPLACNACHGQTSPTPQNAITEKHPKHTWGGTTDYAYDCVLCHAQTVNSTPAITSYSKHVNGVKEVVFSGIAGGGSYQDAPVGQCNNVYCHSNGRGTYTTTPAWDDTGTDCGYCHSQQSDSTPNWSFPHTEHVKTYPNRFYCADCHSGATPGFYDQFDDISTHVDGIKNVVFAGTGTYNNTNYTCSNVDCHLSEPAAWNAGSQGCSYCHDSPDAGGVLLKATLEDLTTPISTAHVEHVATDSGEYGNSTERGTKKISCENCHKDTTDNGTSLNATGYSTYHVDLVNTVTLDSSAINSTAPSGTWSGVSKACSSTYCHGASMPYGSAQGADMAPLWSDTAYITGDPLQDCGQCHGAPPVSTGAGTYSIDTHDSLSDPGLTSCDGCHPHLNEGGTFNDITKHIDGIVQASGCTGCHGQPPMTDSDVITSTPTGRATDYANGAGAHALHNSVGFGDGNCGVCHAGGGSADTGHMGVNAVTMGFTHVQTGGTYNAPTFSLNSYIVNSGDGITVVNNNQGAAGSPRVCTNIYCHSDGAGNKLATPNWDDTYTYPADCDQCHGDRNGTGTGYAISTKHPVHAGTYAQNCVECHAATVNSSMTITTPANHVDGTKQVQFGGSSGGDGASWNGTQKTCSTLYCHSKGTTNTGAAGLTTPDWDLTMDATCTSCHQGDSSSGNVMGSGAGNNTAAHLTHVSDTDNEVGFNIDCAECHNATVSSGTRTISGATYHVNRQVSVKFDQSGFNTDGPTFATQNAGTGVAEVAPGGGAGACNIVYCHSDGNTVNDVTHALTFKNIAWNVAIDCTGCHGNGSTQAFNSPDYPPAAPNTKGGNSHVAHVGSSVIACDKCHWGTTNDPNVLPSTVLSGTNHINRLETVEFKTISAQSGTYEVDGTCSNTYCHGATSPYWGNSAAGLTCQSCHQSQGPDSGTFTAVHAKHTNATGSGYDLSCENCHATMDSTTNTEHTGGPSPTANQTAEVAFTDATGTTTHGGGAQVYRYKSLDTNPFGAASSVSYNAGGAVAGTDSVNGGITWTNGTCTVWCHSNANPRGGTNSYVTTQTWSGTFSTCNECHSSAGNSTAHAEHVNNATHDFKCNECHGATTDASELVSTAAMRTKHVDGTKDVVWKTGGVNDGGTAYSAAAGTCSIYCHSEGTNFVTPGAPAVAADWDLTLANDCAVCHTGGTTTGPNYASGSPKANSHLTHTQTYSFTCVDCHDTVMATAATLAYPATQHIDKTYDVDGTNVGTYNTGTKQCSTASCHGNGIGGAGITIPTWGTPTSGDCGDCHGVTAATPPASASHARHVGSAAGYQYRCFKCHKDDVTYTANSTTAPAAALDLVNHVNGSPNAVLNTTDTEGIVGGTASYSAGQCSNVYCHGAAMPNQSNGDGTNDAITTTPNWTDNLITGVWDTDCQACHGFPPKSGGLYVKTTHDSITNFDGGSCSGCHNHVIATDAIETDWVTTAFSDQSLHINGVVEGGDCYSCHVLGVTSEVEDFADGTAANFHGNAVTSSHNESEWTSSGHGRTSGNYASGNPAANLGSGVTACEACHTSGMVTDGTNPFSLLKTDSQLCLDCHDTAGTNPPSGYSAATQAKVGAAHYNLGSSSNARHDTGSYDGGKFCWNCHDPHGTAGNTFMIGLGNSKKLTKDTDQTYGIPAGGTAGAGRTATVTFTATRTVKARTDYVSEPTWSGAKVCQACHVTGTHGMTKYASGGTNSNHNGTAVCTDCHKHDDTGFKGLATDSDGYSACGACHGDLFSSDAKQATMHGSLLQDGTSPAIRINYKHYMNNDDVVTGTGFSQGGLSYYPTDLTSSTADDVDVSPTNDAKRRCLMCHVDHDVFRRDKNYVSTPGDRSPGRAYNLRTTIQQAPVTGQLPGNAGRYTNTDFDETQTDGGICMSCHFKERNKKIETPNGATKTPPIPFPMSTGTEAEILTKATDLMIRSTHNYKVLGAVYNGPGGTETTRFEAVCLKCHNDSIGNNYGPKSQVRNGKGSQVPAGTCVGASGTTPQQCRQNGGTWDGDAAFGRHISSNDSSLALMGTRFEQGTAGTDPSPAATRLYRDPANQAWDVDEWIGYQVVLTSGTGEHSRALVIEQNQADYLVVKSPGFQSAPEAGVTKYDIVKSPLPNDELCFSCHTTVAKGGKMTDGYDWYGQEPIKPILEALRGIFQAESNKTVASGIPNGANKTQPTLNTTNCWPASPDPNSLAGYRFKWSGGSVEITANAASTGTAPNCQTVVTLAAQVTVPTNDTYSIFKPASHPLDSYGRHRPYERVTAGIGWNQGDEGSASVLGTTTSLTDSSKAWVTDQWKDTTAGQPMYLYLVKTANPLNMGESRPIRNSGGSSNDATTIYVSTAFPAIINATDTYFIGGATDSRHVSCADCHNTHASTHNPEGHLEAVNGDLAGNSCIDYGNGNGPYCLKSTIAVNSHWAPDEWKGHLLKVRSVTNGFEQIRFVTKFDRDNGVFTVATPWTTAPADQDQFELLMGDLWTSSGQLGGLAGSGSTGVWGITPKPDLDGPGGNSPGSPLVVSNWPVPTTNGQLMTDTQMQNNMSWTKVENVFDIKTPYGWYGGSADTGQRDLCVRCHSYYSYRLSRPMSPSGHPSGSNELETDAVKEFNPQNLAHHAVYARGKNQPITPGTGTASNYNPNWPAFGASTFVIGGANSADRVDINTSGVATFTGGNIPDNTLPGWFLYAGSGAPAQGATSGWYEVVEVNSRTSVTVKPAPGSAISSSPFRLTAGLGNTFVPPYGPWSILRCTDCHGSTKTDPVGPHASVNKWLIKSLDTDLRFEWWRNGSVQQIYPVNVNAPNTQYVCYNCHRRDVYLDFDGSAVPPDLDNANMSRVAHGEYMDGDSNTKRAGLSYTPWPQHCRLCHAGDKLGGVHGTNSYNTASPSPTVTNKQGKRFLNGASWAAPALTSKGKAQPQGLNRPTTGATGACYTTSEANNVTSCAKGHDAQGMPSALRATYDYDNP